MVFTLQASAGTLLRRSPQQLLYLSVIERTFSWREVALREPHRHHSHLFKLGAHEPKIDRKAVAIGKQCIVGKRKIKPPKWETICSIGLDRTRLPGQKRPHTYSDPLILPIRVHHCHLQRVVLVGRFQPHRFSEPDRQLAPRRLCNPGRRRACRIDGQRVRFARRRTQRVCALLPAKRSATSIPLVPADQPSRPPIPKQWKPAVAPAIRRAMDHKGSRVSACCGPLFRRESIFGASLSPASSNKGFNSKFSLKLRAKSCAISCSRSGESALPFVCGPAIGPIRLLNMFAGSWLSACSR